VHGDARGTVSKYHNHYGADTLPYNAKLISRIQNKMKHAPFSLDKTHRKIVCNAALEQAKLLRWTLIALHVRSNHLHLVIKPYHAPERMMQTIKAACSRALNKYDPRLTHYKKWTEHGSTRYLWSPVVTNAAIRYVLYEQGTPMSWYCHPDYVIES
jgi:REP element-mobilizing transposase RayT